MNKIKPKLLWVENLSVFFIISILCYITGLVFVMVHEQTHAQIFYSYNSSASIHINYFFLTGYTQGEEGKCNELCNIAQNNVEAIGYHLQILIFALWMLFLGFVLLRRMQII